METTHNLEFETRGCSNEGCQKTFKVLTTSKQKVCSLNCGHGPGVSASDFVRKPQGHPARQAPVNLELIREKDRAEAALAVAKAPPKKITLAPVPVPEPVPPPPPTKDLKKEWDAAVEEARTIFKYMSSGRMEIATKALYACEINHGGGDHWNDFEGVYTLTKFAEDIGIHYKTLHQWVRIKRNIFDKVGSHWNTRNFMIAIRADTRVQPDMTKKEVTAIYLEEAARTKDSTRFRTLCKNLNTIVNLDIRGKSIFEGVTEEQLIACLDSLDKVRKIVKTKMKEV